MRRAVMVAFVLATVLMSTTASGQEDSRTVLTVGLGQPWTTLNVTAGFTVSEYEYWTIQYATLTDKAAADFETIPGLAESWTASDDGLSYTYVLRDGLKWSDGQPLTADDVAWTVNTSRDQGWSNHAATTQNLEAEVIDQRTVRITSSVPDPKLPTMDVYILPRHIWEEHAPDGEAVVSYEALDGVGSGAFVLDEYVPGQFLRMKRNPNYWGTVAGLDEIVFRIFTNDDAMVAALQQGQIDAAHGIPAASIAALEADPNIEVIVGYQGGFDEIAINGGGVEGPPHPALLDIEVRRAINYAVDKEAVIEDVLAGYGEPATTISPSADPSWVPEIPAGERFNYDVERANQILDDAGYLDTNGDGIREMPGGGEPLVLRHAVNSDSATYGAIANLFAGWMQTIGIGVELTAYDENQLYEIIATGEYDTFAWGWTPFVDPSPMLSYFTSDELGNYNDANWSDPRYDELYHLQNQELDEDRRKELVHEMLRIFYDSAVYIPLYYSPDLQAYRSDRFEGWVRQPAEIGPVMFSNSSPSYVLLTPVAGEGAGAGGWLPIAIGAGAVVVAAGLLIGLNRRRRATADERE
jgi:peptide/nickel transport system substrate-binding protein